MLNKDTMAFDAQTATQIALGSALGFSLIGLAQQTNPALFAEPWFLSITVAVFWMSLKY